MCVIRKCLWNKYDPNSDIKHFLDKRIKVAKYFHTFLVAFHNKIKSNQIKKLKTNVVAFLDAIFKWSDPMHELHNTHATGVID